MDLEKQYSEGYAVNNGVKIFYHDHGPADGEPILLVHGLGAQLVHWPEHLIDFLKEHNYRPITYDNRDVGLSSRFVGEPAFVLDYVKYFLRLPLKSEYTIDDMAEDGIKLLDSLGIKKAHILGTSMGGMIAQIISSQYSERVKSLTLIASTASTPSPLNAPTSEVRELMMQRSKNPNASVEEAYEREVKIVTLIGMEGRVVDTPEFREDTFKNFERAADGSGYARQMLAILASKNRLQKVKKIKAATLIIHGEYDPMIDVKNAYTMHKLIPQSSLEIIPGMRHLIEPEVLEMFEEKLLEHLKLWS
ncbi:alpha/beta hydrolase [Gammaproteobacteria bacterium]|nr:alpha/beta hydrolase [Gammaproteobacteria bacterium]